MSSNRQGFVQTSFAYLVYFLLPLNLSADLNQVDQVSQPSGFVSQSEAIEGGTSKNSVTPDLLTNGYAFGYWEINGVRQAGDDNRSLVQVSTTISANTTFNAFYFSESADSDNDGIKDWYEYRMFGSLNLGPTDNPDGDGYSNKEESELGQDPLIVDEVEWGGISGRLSSGFTYADTSMVLAVVKSDPAGFVTETSNYLETNSTVTTSSLHGATNGYNFAYWSVNGVRQAGPTGVSLSKVSEDVNATTMIIAHYKPSNEDSDSDGVMDWFELYQFGSLDLGATDDPDGDGFSNKHESELGQEATIADTVEWGGISGRLSTGFNYADTSMVLAVVKSDPAGFVTETSNYLEENRTVTTSSLHGATNGYNFAYWSVNGVRQAGSTGVSLSKVATDVNATTNIVAHYKLSNEDSDSDGVMDWFELYQFGNLNQSGSEDPDGDGYTIAEELALGQESTIEDSVEWGGVSGRLSNGILYFQQQNRPPSNLELNNTIAFLNKDANQTIGTFTPTDPDDPGRVRTYSYQLLSCAGGEDNNKFNLLGRNLRTSQTFTLEGNHSIIVRVTDDENASFDKNFTIRAIHDPNKDDDSDGLTYSQEVALGTSDNNPDSDGDGLNDGKEVENGSSPINNNSTNYPPNKIEISRESITENLPIGTVIGVFHVYDPDNSDQNQLSIEFTDGEGSEHNSKFTIDSNKTLKTGSVFSFEENASLRIRVLAKDLLGATFEKGFTIKIGKDFSNSSLNGLGIDFTNSDFRSSNFSGIRTESYADFTGSYLIYSNFSGGNKKQTKFISANLSFANFKGANLYGSNFSNADVNGTVFFGASFNNSTTWPNGFDPQNAKAFGPGIDFRDFDLTDFNLIAGDLQNTNFEGADLSGKRTEVADFSGANFKNANLSGGNKKQTKFINADLRGANLSGANLTGSIFTGAIYNESTIWPDGFDPVAAGAISRNKPKDLNSTTLLTFQENQLVGTVIGEFNATDPDGDAISYHFVNEENNNSLFTLDSNGTLKTATTFDYESNASSYTITVQAMDELNATTEGNFTITLIDIFEDLDEDGIADHLDEDTDGDGYLDGEEVAFGSNPKDANSLGNRAPTSLFTSNTLSILENLPAGEFLAEFNATDGESNSTFTYSLADGTGSGGNAFFSIDANGTLRTAAVLDYETHSSHTVRVRVSDQHNYFLDKNFTIQVQDMDEGTAPTLGDGSEENPYQIDTLAHLKWLSFSDSDWENKHFIQTSDINATETKTWANGYGFSPIAGKTQKHFTGTYNGQFFKIYGIVINRPNTGGIGLFSKTQGATLKNINITDGNFIGKITVGGLTGLADLNSTIQNSSFEGIISGQIRVGGLVGRNTSSQILRSFSRGVVNAEEYEVGGIVGSNNSNKSKIIDCYSDANVSGSFKVGGLAGLNAHGGSITRSYSSGFVSKVSSSGGLVGATDSNITNSFWDINSSGVTTSAGSGAVGKTTAEMMDPSTFLDAGWDFNASGGTWKMTAGQSYPRLAWENTPTTLPYDLNNTTPLQVLENQPVGTVVGHFTAKHLDVPSNIWFGLVGEGGYQQNIKYDNDFFSMDRNGTLRTLVILDYEANTTLTLNAKVGNVENYDLITKIFTVQVVNVVEDFDGDGIEDAYDPDNDNDGFSNAEEIAYGSNPWDAKSIANASPTDLTLSNHSILENQPAGTIVGQLIGSDPDANTTLDYSRVLGPGDQHNSYFVIDQNRTLRTTQSLDYESDDHNLSVRIRVRDEHNASLVKVFTIALLDMNDTDTPPITDHERSLSPIVQTGSFSTDGNGTYRFEGKILSREYASILEAGIRIKPADSNTTQLLPADLNGTGGIISITTNTLTAGGTYFYRAYALSTAGESLGTIRRIEVSDRNDTRYWWSSIASARTDGWIIDSWMGDLLPYSNQWAYHRRLGWIFMNPDGNQGYWLWRQKNGWLWTNSDSWPFLWAHQSVGWLYLLPVKNKALFYDYGSEMIK